MKKAETKNEKKFELTAEQLKEILMPFIEDAKNKASSKNKDYSFKFLNINKCSQYGLEYSSQQEYRIDFIVKGFPGHINLFIADNAHLCFYVEKSAYLESAATAGEFSYDTDPIMLYLADHSGEIDDALMGCLYSIYGEDYKECLIESATKSAREQNEDLKKQIEEKKKHIETEQRGLKALEREQKEVKENFNKIMQKIENLSNPHQV